MSKKKLLIVSDPDKTNTGLLEWSNANNEFEISFASSDEEAIELFQLNNFDLVVADNTAEAIDTRKLTALLPVLQDDAALLGYDGELAGELQTRIERIFYDRKLERVKRFLVLDSSNSGAWNELPPFSAN
jgi:PleD family two-component response regulator